MKTLVISEKVIATIQFEVTVSDAENFVTAFEKKFPKKEEDVISEISSWYEVEDGWCVNASVATLDRSKFIKFVSAYCKKKDLIYKPNTEVVNS